MVKFKNFPYYQCEEDKYHIAKLKEHPRIKTGIIVNPE